MEYKVVTFDKESPLITWCRIWSEKRKFNFEKDLISDFGYMGFYGETAVASVFLYPVISAKFCLIGIPISDPSAPKDIRQKAMDLAVAEAEKAAKLLNRDYVLSYVDGVAAKTLLSSLKYERVTDNVSLFVKKI